MPEIALPGWLDLVDLAFVAALLWAGIGYVRRTRARAALVGVGVLAIVFVLARLLELRLTATILQAFFAVFAFVLVVVFQEDLRRFFERLGTWRRDRAQSVADSTTQDVLVRTLSRLAATRTGALVVIPGQEPIDRHLEGGIAMGGRMSEPLLLSLFDSSSPGHDGAVLLNGATIERFAVHLPLSANHEAVGPGGTRHAAALGLAERCDATCIVVSEERGTISIARNGELRVLERPEDLLTEPALRGDERASRTSLGSRQDLRDAALAVLGALVLWSLFVGGDAIGETTVSVPIELSNLPADLVLEAVEPATAEVVLQGPRRALLLAGPQTTRVYVDAYLARLGRRTFLLRAANVEPPDRLSIVSVAPDQIRLSFVAREPSEGE